jgi:integrase
VAKVIAEARARNTALGLYLWLVVVTGVRRGELCGLQIRDIDLERALVHIADQHSFQRPLQPYNHGPGQQFHVSDNGPQRRRRSARHIEVFSVPFS